MLEKAKSKKKNHKTISHKTSSKGLSNGGQSTKESRPFAFCNQMLVLSEL